MRKFKIVLFSVLCMSLVSLFSFGVFAAVYLNVRVTGTLNYASTEIGARIWGTRTINRSGGTGTPAYMLFSGENAVTENNVYYVQGEEASYSVISSNAGNITLDNATDTVEFYLFIKNVGDRYIIPVITTSATDSHVKITTTNYYFDVSAGHLDPLEKQNQNPIASSFINSIKGEISANRVSNFQPNMSIDNEDTFVSHVVLSLDTVTGDGTVDISSDFYINISFMADIQYDTSTSILSVYQEQNLSSPQWTKFGYNANLDAQATKIDTNQWGTLIAYLDSAKNTNGNVSKAVVDQYYESAPVYKDIDIVNVDIATGEIIGKLSDPTYNFEWFGREITLESGTKLASGRTLTSEETFTVDVYTYYPEMYLRRWVIGNEQWISLSDKPFTGSVKIESYYTATFEATIFNPDRSVATVLNEDGNKVVIPRSYLYNYTPLTSGSVKYLQDYYNFEKLDGTVDSATPSDTGLSASDDSNASTTQANMLQWSSNLTKTWESSSLSSQYRTVKGVQGENYTAYIYNLLYLVKYANNDSQAIVGYGNTYTYGLYTPSGTTVTTESGMTVTTGITTVDGSSTTDVYARYESERGGGTIGVYDSSSKGSATYDPNTHKLSQSGFNNAGMNYGYNVEYTHNNDPQGLYATQFLVYTNADTNNRYLLDGYVGSDKYTSVFCLGQANPWGNVWTWIFGVAVASDSVDLWAYINYEDYDYTTQNWVTNSQSGGSNGSINFDRLEDANYTRLSYALPNTDGYYNYLGTSSITSETGIESLIGMPTKESDRNSGLADYYYCNNSTSYTFGCLRGGGTYVSTHAGAFCFYVSTSLAYAYATVGFRPSLISVRG